MQKGAGYHLDLLVLAIYIGIASLFGLVRSPMPQEASQWMLE